MASDKARFLVSRTYSVVTPESAEIGDTADNGFIFERRPMSLQEVIAELADCITVSVWPVLLTSDLTGHEWASTEPSTDWSTGDIVTESVHIAGIDGDLSPENLFRIFRLAKLI